MLKITLDQAERIESVRNDLHWDGWTLVHTKPNALGQFRSDGLRRDGRWFTAKRYPVNSDGLYHVPKVIGRGL